MYMDLLLNVLSNANITIFKISITGEDHEDKMNGDKCIGLTVES
jgi:hypothetical protein